MHSPKNALNEKPKLWVASGPICLPVPGLITRVGLSQSVWKHCHSCRALTAQNICETVVLTPVLTSYLACRSNARGSQCLQILSLARYYIVGSVVFPAEELKYKVTFL